MKYQLFVKLPHVSNLIPQHLHEWVTHSDAWTRFGYDKIFTQEFPDESLAMSTVKY